MGSKIDRQYIARFAKLNGEVNAQLPAYVSFENRLNINKMRINFFYEKAWRHEIYTYKQLKVELGEEWAARVQESLRRAGKAGVWVTVPAKGPLPNYSRPDYLKEQHESL